MFIWEQDLPKAQENLERCRKEADMFFKQGNAKMSEADKWMGIIEYLSSLKANHEAAEAAKEEEKDIDNKGE